VPIFLRECVHRYLQDPTERVLTSTDHSCEKLPRRRASLLPCNSRRPTCTLSIEDLTASMRPSTSIPATLTRTGSINTRRLTDQPHGSRLRFVLPLEPHWLETRPVVPASPAPSFVIRYSTLRESVKLRQRDRVLHGRLTTSISRCEPTPGASSTQPALRKALTESTPDLNSDSAVTSTLCRMPRGESVGVTGRSGAARNRISDASPVFCPALHGEKPVHCNTQVVPAIHGVERVARRRKEDGLANGGRHDGAEAKPEHDAQDGEDDQPVEFY